MIPLLKIGFKIVIVVGTACVIVGIQIVCVIRE